MYTITVNNVNEAIYPASIFLREQGVIRPSRVGEVIELTTPLVTTYTRPTERVLYNAVRRCNPFFHLFEAIWIMAGRKDVQFISEFNPRMKTFSDNGKEFNAPYGYRLRNHFTSDQIMEVHEILRRDRYTRRAVMQIWDCDYDLGTFSKDLPCNTTIYFRIQNVEDGSDALDITVCNRSNDMIWGAYGANVVQFSMLQEVMALSLGVEVGVYYQFSNNFHAYTDNPFWKKIAAGEVLYHNPYKDQKWSTLSLVNSVNDMPLYRWLRDASMFCDYVNGDSDTANFSNEWFLKVPMQMYYAWVEHSLGRVSEAIEAASFIEAEDWREASLLWMAQQERMAR